MKSEELLKRLTKEQKVLLERATGGQIVEKGRVEEIKSKLNEISLEDEFQEWIPIPYELRETVIKRGMLSDKAEKNFNEVYRYLNSLEGDEEVKKRRVAEMADSSQKEYQKIIYHSLMSGLETIKEIKEEISELEHNKCTNLSVRFGLAYEEVFEIIKYEYDFNRSESYEANHKNDKENDLWEKLFGK